ncbi:MAG: TlyA family RNA methyltransferase, partial [Clostridia bacterium]|nr:TlyA family RNA methyltransferase [Clostridia bacterium]
MRLDVYLQSRELVKSRTRAKEYISLGRVKVNGKTLTKPSAEVTDADEVTLLSNALEYVGRGAHKLEGALDAFNIDVAGARCIDVGASTGGFTEVLLRRGAAAVTAVDSGHGQLDRSLREDPRVRDVEGCNARYMKAEEVGDGYDIAVMDVSFISQTYIHPALFGLLCDGGKLISLVKPQFE